MLRAPAFFFASLVIVATTACEGPRPASSVYTATVFDGGPVPTLVETPTVAPAAEKLEWRRARSEAGGFSVELPAAPAEEKPEHFAPSVVAQLHGLRASVAAPAMLLQAWGGDLTREAGDRSAADLFKALRDALAHHGQPDRAREIAVKGLLAQELVVTPEAGKLLRIRLLIGDKRAFVLLAHSEPAGAADAERFLESFQVVE